MYSDLFKKFLASDDTLQVYEGVQLIFSSGKDRLLPLLEYLERFAPHHQGVTILDRITGNAAALLSVKADCREVYSPLGSQLAVQTLERHGIKYHLVNIVPCIQKPDGDMCPMEKLSMGKEPEEFYEEMKRIINGAKASEGR